MGVLQIAGIRPLEVSSAIPLHLLVVIPKIAGRNNRVKIRRQGWHIRRSIGEARVRLPGQAAIEGFGFVVIEEAVARRIQAAVIPGGDHNIPRADADGGTPLVGLGAIIAQVHFRAPGGALIARAAVINVDHIAGIVAIGVIGVNHVQAAIWPNGDLRHGHVADIGVEGGAPTGGGGSRLARQGDIVDRVVEEWVPGIAAID